MKKHISILLTIMLGITLIACSNQPTVQPNSTDSKVDSSAAGTASGDIKDDDSAVSSDGSTSSSTEQTSSEPSTTNTSSESWTDGPTTTTTKPPVTSQTKPQPKPPVTSKTPSQTPQETVSQPKWATEADEKLVADKIIEYINKYRVEEGHCAATKLSPRLTEYAEYRSRQLVKSGLVHDTDDERAAATALKYGRYFSREFLEQNQALDTTPYWEANAREAIGGGVPILYKTVDELAETFATAFRNSPGHWAYVGGGEKTEEYDEYDKYKYIGVGVCYNGGSWYVAIAMVREECADELR